MTDAGVRSAASADASVRAENGRRAAAAAAGAREESRQEPNNIDKPFFNSLQMDLQLSSKNVLQFYSFQKIRKGGV